MVAICLDGESLCFNVCLMGSYTELYDILLLSLFFVYKQFDRLFFVNSFFINFNSNILFYWLVVWMKNCEVVFFQY